MVRKRTGSPETYCLFFGFFFLILVFCCPVLTGFNLFDKHLLRLTEAPPAPPSPQYQLAWMVAALDHGPRLGEELIFQPQGLLLTKGVWVSDTGLLMGPWGSQINDPEDDLATDRLMQV